ncbi:TetM/TetW/TetO/TetS family tetracycline resistance ribosomal protection protein [Streptomyces sp. ME02-6991-2A]|uniref:translation factor GTPase family protein n=1 Tax=Streptomyces sp. ME02-6991-2A TaxID=3028677 RepID=UPI0029B9BA21|nr:translation factor GTPase family protein [Streptomyces sp. ME02-6991-2A]MDX3374431.1 TetM/TetW/TetO/TetS family tetracycline resistance ribosomal protection protein [Streptomyces sp. ME02-6991-2A]
MHTENLGILAHVDAGKTSLTERLLHTAGTIDTLGSVDDGSTQTDSLALERRRGITIKSGVVSFTLGATTVNLIDTPGHPDFIAEVERVLGVLDGAVLVVSAVEGVQAQTRVLLRTLRRLRIPTLLFVNKTDRPGARYDSLLTSITERLSPDIVVMGSTQHLGIRSATTTPFTGSDPGFTAALTDLLTRHDDELLTAYVDDPAALTHARLLEALAEQTARCRVHPVFFGSAATGAGIDALADGITGLLPAARGDAEAPARGTVFKVDRTANGERTAYVRMVEGTVHAREVLRFRSPDGREGEDKVSAVTVFEDGGEVPVSAVGAGRIGRLKGLAGIRIGDSVGEARAEAGRRHFAPPTLETVVVPVRPEDRGALHIALGRLAEQDPLIAVRRDDLRQEVSLSLYGEVQKEVIQATLADEFGVDVTFRATTTICLERPAGTGAAVEIIDTDPNPFLATVGLRVDPAPYGSGVEFRREVELGSMPYSLMRAVEETVLSTLTQGIHGWQVTDCVVTQTHSGYWPRQSHSHGTFDKSMSSTAGDFRNLTPLVLMDALRRAGTQVYEPMHRFRLELPTDTFGALVPVLARLRAVPGPPEMRGAALCTLEGELPAARVHELQQLLPGLTRGEGMLESAFDGHRPVTGPVPDRPRTDHDPLHRKEYLLRTVRRVAG